MKGWVDPERVGMMGGSYGGYFAALAVTQYSRRLPPASSGLGVTSPGGCGAVP
jgi:dipeptidyl aminopeptidase/acylaminoacyl peptidase